MCELSKESVFLFLTNLCIIATNVGGIIDEQDSYYVNVRFILSLTFAIINIIGFYVLKYLMPKKHTLNIEMKRLFDTNIENKN